MTTALVFLVRGTALFYALHAAGKRGNPPIRLRAFQFNPGTSRLAALNQATKTLTLRE